MAFEDALAFVLKWEGGYVNDPADPGGETNLGISKRQYPALDIPSLTPQTVAPIYRKDYWDAAGCDRYEPNLGLCVFDAAVNHGVPRALGFLRQAADACDYCAVREQFYRGLVASKPQLGKFLKGWLARVADLRATVGCP